MLRRIARVVYLSGSGALIWLAFQEPISMADSYDLIVLPDTIARGELRPLRDPASASAETQEPVLT